MKHETLEFLFGFLNINIGIRIKKEYSTKKYLYCMSGLYETRHTNVHIIKHRFDIIGGTSSLFVIYDFSDNNIKGVAIIYRIVLFMPVPEALSDRPSALLARVIA